MADEVFETNTISGCQYTLGMTWDMDFLWVGLSSDSCRRFLGDFGGDEFNPPDLSFFVAIDVDQIFGSGAPQDGYGNVNFYGCYMPEYVFYFAGGGGWYEWGHWNGASWDWNGWRNDNTYYAWFGGNVWDDELGILWSDLGHPQGILADCQPDGCGSDIHVGVSFLLPACTGSDARCGFWAEHCGCDKRRVYRDPPVELGRYQGSLQVNEVLNLEALTLLVGRVRAFFQDVILA